MLITEVTVKMEFQCSSKFISIDRFEVILKAESDDVSVDGFHVLLNINLILNAQYAILFFAIFFDIYRNVNPWNITPPFHMASTCQWEKLTPLLINIKACWNRV